MNQLSDNAKQDAIEFKENYLAMGENQVFIPIQITIDYVPNLLSFYKQYYKNHGGINADQAFYLNENKN